MRKGSRIIALIMAALFVGGILFGVIVSAAYAQSEMTYFASPISGKSKGSSIYIRKAPGSEKGDNILVKLSGMKGVVFSFTGESGDFYYTKYESYDGLGQKSDFRLPPSSTPVPSSAPAEGEWRSVGSAVPTSTPKPDVMNAVSTPQPTREVEQQSITTVSAASTPVAQSYAVATGGSADVWGSISIPGSKSYKIYCNARNKNNTDFYYNKDYTHIFAMTPQNAQVAVIMGHNMRKSASMFHSLHHVQNAWLGKAKCERCGASCAASKSSTFNASYNGASKWELVCFYETEKSEPASTLSYNALSTGDAGSYASYQLSRAASSSKGKVLSSAGSGDKLMMLITCGDKIGGSTGARLYMLLKAVG